MSLTQEKEQNVNLDNPSFIIQLKDSTIDIEKLNIYAGSLDNKSKIKCVKDNEQTYITCSPDKSNMQSGKNEIFYDNQCGVTSTTGITVNYSPFDRITINKISIGNSDTQCTNSPITTFTLTLGQDDSSSEATGTLIKDDKEIEYKCSIDNKRTITCTTSESISEGTYTIQSIKGANVYDFNDGLSKQLIYETEPLGIQNVTNPIIRSPSPIFTINLKSSDTPKPTIYVGNDKNNGIKCKKKKMMIRLLHVN